MGLQNFFQWIRMMTNITDTHTGCPAVTWYLQKKFSLSSTIQGFIIISDKNWSQRKSQTRNTLIQLQVSNTIGQGTDADMAEDIRLILDHWDFFRMAYSHKSIEFREVGIKQRQENASTTLMWHTNTHTLNKAWYDKRWREKDSVFMTKSLNK